MDKKMTNRLLAVIVLIGAIAICFIYITYAGRPAVPLTQVSRGSIVSGIALDGTVKGKNEVQLGFENLYPTRIAKLFAKTGDLVKAGTVLAQLENSDAQAQYAQSLAVVTGAQAALDESNKTVKMERLKVDGLSSDAKKVQKAQVEATLKGVAVQKATLLSAQAGVASAQAQLAKTIIKAPFDGIIANQDVQAGDLASPGMPIITLVSDQNTFEIDVLATEQDATKIKIGDMAEATLDAYGKTNVFKAQVETIDPVATVQDGATAYKITLLLSGNDERVKSGLNANVFIGLDEKKDVLEVSQKAIIAEGNKQFVLVFANGVQQKKEIITGIVGADGMVEIVSGLSDGESVVE